MKEGVVQVLCLCLLVSASLFLYLLYTSLSPPSSSQHLHHFISAPSPHLRLGLHEGRRRRGDHVSLYDGSGNDPRLRYLPEQRGGNGARAGAHYRRGNELGCRHH